MNRRLIAAVITLLLFSYLIVLGAYNIHQLLSRQMTFSLGFLICVHGLFSVPEIRTWAFLMELLMLLWLFWLLYGTTANVRTTSKMIHVCPRIKTPAAEGQGQYGTARWMTAGEINQAYTVIHMDRHSTRLRELKAAGRDDLEECG